MSQYCILPKGKLVEWFEWLLASYRVFAPKAQAQGAVFVQASGAQDLYLEYTQTDLPPKKCIIPPRQLLYEFDVGEMRLRPVVEAIPTVLFGVHTCDQHAIRLFDRIFSHGFADQHYGRQRESTLIVGLECMAPCSSESFCRSMGTTSPAIGTFDLHLVDMGPEYCIEIGSERGAQLVQGFRGVFVASDSDLAQRNHVLAEKWQHFSYRLDCDVTEIPGLLGAAYESGHWNDLGAICLACGMCTQVCPTCYCFDIEDRIDLTLSHGSRVRRWDSCQINDFALVAGGHNFREKRAERQRHRFLRKGKYQFEANDMVGCVGCGRCATACLAHITPITTFNTLWREQQAARSGPQKEAG